MASNPDQRVGNIAKKLGVDMDGAILIEEALALTHPLKLEPTKDLRPLLTG